MDRLHLRRAGFTLIELLVVVAIIGALLGLLLPAVQKVRESANRTACGNNMRQLGLALHEFHDINGYLPESDTSINFHRSWVYDILPNIDQKAVYDLYDINHNWFNVQNKYAVTTQIKTLNCPSTPLQNRVDPSL